MLETWMLQSLAIGALLAVAAVAVERVLQGWQVQTRFVWLAALVGTLLLSVAPLPVRTVSHGEAASAGSALGTITPVFPQGFEVPAPTATSNSDVLIALWLLGSAVAMGWLLLAHLRLSGLRRHWERAEIEGIPVLLSEDVGPAVLGVWRREIVLPKWVAAMDGRKRSLTVQHEMEHLRSGDTQLALIGLATIVALPWNLPMWWIVRRLRAAIELDCDRRVVESCADVHTYSSLLVEMAARSRSAPLLAAAFASRPTQVERRVRAMTRPAGRFRGPATLLGSIVALGLTVTACEMARPTPDATAPVPGERIPAVEAERVTSTAEPETDSDEPDTDTAEPSRTITAPPSIAVESRSIDRSIAAPGPPAADAPEVDALRPPPTASPALGVPLEPAFTPRTVDPRLSNRQDFVAALERGYPPMLKDAGIGGTSMQWVLIDADGTVQTTRLVQSSGYPELDRAAAELLVSTARFTPAQNNGENVAVWVQIPVSFAVSP